MRGSVGFLKSLYDQELQVYPETAAFPRAMPFNVPC